MYFLYILYRISLPFLKLYNFLINRRYIPDNDRNNQIYDYLWKIVKDPTYQPTTPVENYAENKIYKNYLEQVIKVNSTNNLETESYERIRLQSAAILAGIMETHMWIDDTKWNVQCFADPFR